MALSLRKNGASVGATVAFFLGNPALNPAVLVWMLLALGWQWALLRLALAVALVVAGATLAARLVGSGPATLGVSEGAFAVQPEGSNPLVRWVRSLIRFMVMFVPLMVGLSLVLGAARAFLFPAISPEWANSWVAIVGLAVAGTLFMIPTGAEIPIVQTMMAYGLGSGPAGALLLTLAPVSVASLAMLVHVFPVRVLAALGGLTVAAGVAAGALAVALGL